ncbi:MAG: hypothetical protein ACOCNS_05165 [Bacteroidales bacterium]
MKKAFMMIAALFLMIAQAYDANAQRPGMDPEMRAEFAKMAAQKVAGELKLDKAEREWFEPLYMEYADSLRKAQKIDLPEKNKEIKEMTDDEALEAVEKMFASQERALAVKRAYYERFKEKLTPQQLFRLFRPKNERRRAAQGQGPFGPGMPPPPGMGGGFHGRPGF